jgi:hypothetical protein
MRVASTFFSNRPTCNTWLVKTHISLLVMF